MAELKVRGRNRASTSRPRILVEPSDYFLRNFGDMAMLQSAVERLQTLLPDAAIEVLTEDPPALARLCPSAIPIAEKRRFFSLKHGYLRSSLHGLLPSRLADRVFRRIPRAIAPWLDDRLRERSQFAKCLRHADALVLGGMGGITDYFGDFAEGLLKSLELAIVLNRPVVLVGQGLGPLENPRLRSLAAAILPRVELIGLREKRAGPALLGSLGVDVARIDVTGDDAVEIAYDMRIEKLGSAIGVNLRRATYSGVTAELASKIGQAIQGLAAARNAPLIPLPIQHGYDSDIESLRSIMPHQADEIDVAEAISSPSELVRQVQRCRLVITGSYHAGVFALANGIPVVGIAASAYYVDKFEGLADMFGEGCRVWSPDGADSTEQLRRAADELWESAERTRSQLLASAERQIASCRATYAKIAALVMSSRGVGARTAEG